MAEEPVEASVEASVEEPVDLELLFDPQEGSGELSVIKERIQSLLRQNTGLTDQARSLKQESLELQEKLQQARAAVVAPAKDRATAPKGLEQTAKDTPGSRQPQSLRLLQSYDMQYQKKNLNWS